MRYLSIDNVPVDPSRKACSNNISSQIYNTANRCRQYKKRRFIWYS